MPLKSHSSSKNGLKTESVSSTESKYNEPEVILQEPKLVDCNLIIL